MLAIATLCNRAVAQDSSIIFLREISTTDNHTGTFGLKN
jgi:hypothetical protein